MTNARIHSRGVWDVPDTLEGINVGSHQRIADALERAATALEKATGSWDRLVAERDMYQLAARAERAEVATLRKRVAGLRGALTRAKGRQP